MLCADNPETLGVKTMGEDSLLWFGCNRLPLNNYSIWVAVCSINADDVRRVEGGRGFVPLEVLCGKVPFP